MQPARDCALDHFIAEFYPDSTDNVLIDDFLNGDLAPDLVPKRSLEPLALLIGQRFGHPYGRSFPG